LNLPPPPGGKLVPPSHTPTWVAWLCFVTAVGALVVYAVLEPVVSSTPELLAGVVIGTLVASTALLAAWFTHVERVTEQRHHFAALEELAGRDELSGLHNYRYLREQMRVELADAQERRTHLAVIMFDLNDFKDVNDRFGHQAGDALIRVIASAIGDEMRGRGTAARYGGDEFTVLLPDTDRIGAEVVALEVANAIAESSVAATPLNRHLRVTASYGIAVFPQDASDAEALIAHADRALYEAKARLTDVRTRTDERHAQDVFFAIGEAIGSSLEPARLLTNLVRAVAESLGIGTCSIWLQEESGRQIWPRAYWVADQDFIRSFAAVQRSQPLTTQEALSRGLLANRTVYVDDLGSSDVMDERFRAFAAPNTWAITVPMHEPRMGFLLLSGTHGEAEPPSTVLAEAIARLASSALANADTFARAHRRAEQLAALAGLGGLLLAEGSYGERVSAIVRRVAEVTGSEMLTLDTEDPTGEMPFVRAFYGKNPDGTEYDERTSALWLSLRPQLTEAPVREFLARATEPIIMRDPLNEVPPAYRNIIIESGTRSVVVMPISWRNDLKGLFYFASYRMNAFDAHDIALMQAIAAQIGPAIEVAALNVKLEQSYGELKEAHRAAIERLAFAAEARDPYTGRHLQRIGALSEAIARRMGFDEEGVEAIGYAAVVHDLGKLKIPDDILTKPGELTEEDWAIMRKHPEFGAELLGKGLFYDVARTVALHHHERWDGSGYPYGLRAEDIPLEARIVAVADVYDALISARPYKHAWPRERALAELLKMRGHKLCPSSIDVFLQLWTEGEIACIEEDTRDASFESDFRERYAA
jgi:diguanylate cyclase (GGDEF)-like protein